MIKQKTHIVLIHALSTFTVVSEYQYKDVTLYLVESDIDDNCHAIIDENMKVLVYDVDSFRDIALDLITMQEVFDESIFDSIKTQLKRATRHYIMTDFDYDTLIEKVNSIIYECASRIFELCAVDILNDVQADILNLRLQHILNTELDKIHTDTVEQLRREYYNTKIEQKYYKTRQTKEV